MKNIEKLLMALFCAFALMSCGGDDEEEVVKTTFWHAI
jgi:hypothetical protein